jgi:hypothetical protein
MSTRVADAPRTWTELLLIGLFLVVLGLPLAAAVTGLSPGAALVERREPAPRPVWRPKRDDVLAYPSRFEAYWNDRFALRPLLIRGHHRIKLALGVAPTDRAILGRRGWLFLRDNYGFDYYRAARPFPRKALEEWARHFEHARSWLAARGIGYLLVVVPDKATIYPEFMPAQIRQVRTVSWADELFAHLRVHTRVEFLDLRDALRAAKGAGPVYWRTDTHWNDRGAFVGYQAIMGHLARSWPELAPLGIQAFELHTRRGPGQDLAHVFGLPDVLTDEVHELRPRAARQAREVLAVAKRPDYWRRLITTRDDAGPGALRAVVIHDSFMRALHPFLSEHFARVVYDWRRQPDVELIETERPDVVIHELAERFLMGPP